MEGGSEFCMILQHKCLVTLRLISDNMITLKVGGRVVNGFVNWLLSFEFSLNLKGICGREGGS